MSNGFSRLHGRSRAVYGVYAAIGRYWPAVRGFGGALMSSSRSWSAVEALGDGAAVFERVLAPHRSLPPSAFHLVMAMLALVSLAVGIGFVAIGAWPVCGFFGLDVGLLYLAFRLSYRSARRSEILRLAGDAFTVERISVH